MPDESNRLKRGQAIERASNARREPALPHGRAAATWFTPRQSYVRPPILSSIIAQHAVSKQARLLSLSRRDKTTVAQQFIAWIARMKVCQSRRDG
jgi:hypothetical protein